MKHQFLIVLAIFFIIICIICIVLINVRMEKNRIVKYNLQYEDYINKEIYGTDVASLISKVVDENNKNNIKKDENDYYIDDGLNSVRIDLKMNTIDRTYPMEEIHKNNLTEFVKNFNTIKFKCINVEYHKKTGKISKIIFEELK